MTSASAGRCARSQPARAASLGVVALRRRRDDALTYHDTRRADLILGEALPLLHPEGPIPDVIGRSWPISATPGTERKQTLALSALRRTTCAGVFLGVTLRDGLDTMERLLH